MGKIRHLSLTIPRQYSHLSLNKCLFLVLRVFCVFLTMYICLVSKYWFCAVLSSGYVVFPAHTLSSHLNLTIDSGLASRKRKVVLPG